MKILEKSFEVLQKTVILCLYVIWAGCFSSCGKKIDFDNGLLKMGEINEIKLGAAADNTKYGISLTVVSVNDYRCPSSVLCASPGEDSVQFKLKTKKGEYNFTLNYWGILPKAIVIEGIHYQIEDILPYPVYHDEEVEKTVKILTTTPQSDLANTKWKFSKRQHFRLSEILTYPQNEQSCVVIINNDFTFDFQSPSCITRGTYCIGNDGIIRFGSFDFKGLGSSFEHPSCQYLPGVWPDWVSIISSSLSSAEKYTISGNQLMIDYGLYDDEPAGRLYFERIR